MSNQHLIVPSNPTPNGDLHLGHIAGPFIGADALRRAALARGESAAVLLGTAWQNTHVLLAAQRQNRPYLDVAAAYAERIEASFAAAEIEYDVMLRHADIPAIEAATRLAFARLAARGAIAVRDAAAHWCASPGCTGWRFQGYVAGRCPHCGSHDASGIDCEGCSVYHDDAELLDPVCTVCGAATELRPLRRAFLELEPQRAWFEDYFARCALGAEVRRFAESGLARPLPAVAISLPGEIGFALDDPALPGQRIYPAFELAPRYTVMLERHGWRERADRRPATVSMLFGIDNAFERVFLFPAVLRAFDADDVPRPEVLQLTYFYLLEGSKFSTSRGHLVGVGEMVDAYGADAVRLYVAATRPETGSTDFTRAAIAASAEVRAVRALRAVAETGRWPAPRRELGPDAVPAGRAELAEAGAVLDRALRPQTLSLRSAAAAVVRLAELALQLEAARAEHGTAELHALRADVLDVLAGGAAALIPDTAERVRAAFGPVARG